MLDFGRFRLDAERRELLLDGEIVPLRSKLFDTLACLIERRDRVVEKEDLLDAVWPGVHVEESTLFQTVSSLRKELERGGLGGSRCIKTVPGRGYRFVAETVSIAPPPVTPPPPALPRAASPPPDSRARRLLTFGSAAAVVLALLSWAGWTRTPELSSRKLVESPLTSYAGSERSPSFSPDGALVAYSRDMRGGYTPDIYLEVVGSGDARPVVTSPASETGLRRRWRAPRPGPRRRRAFAAGRCAAGPRWAGCAPPPSFPTCPGRRTA